MKVYYFTPYCILRARTNQIGDVRLCEGFAENGCEVELICPYQYRKDNIKKSEVLKAYGVEHPYPVRILKTPLWDMPRKHIIVPVLLICAALYALWITVRHYRRLPEIFIMSRSVFMLMPFVVMKKILPRNHAFKVIPWIHEVPSSKHHVWVFKHSDGIVGTNSSITADVHKKYGTPKPQLAVSLNPITTAQTQINLDRESAREAVGLTVDKPLIVYTGKVGIGITEVDYIIKAAAHLPECQFLLTGGKPHVVEHYEAYCREHDIQNVTLTGFLDNYKDVIYYQFAADALVSYYTEDQHAVAYNFPNKICEYMLAGRPIITPDFAATRDVLHEGNTIFVDAENTEALVAGIRLAVTDHELAERLGNQVRHDVQEITFKKRTKILMDFFASL